MAKEKIAQENREALRKELRDKGKGKRKAVREKVRGAATALVALVSLSFLFGCASATPSSKSQTSTAKHNVITININIAAPTNALACAAVPGGLSFTITDLLGTQVQSADAGGNESVNQTATPTNTSGVTGDKPIETIGEVGKTAITGGASAVTAEAKKLLAGSTTSTTAADAAAKATAAASGAACSDGSCTIAK